MCFLSEIKIIPNFPQKRREKKPRNSNPLRYDTFVTHTMDFFKQEEQKQKSYSTLNRYCSKKKLLNPFITNTPSPTTYHSYLIYIFASQPFNEKQSNLPHHITNINSIFNNITDIHTYSSEKHKKYNFFLL